MKILGKRIPTCHFPNRVKVFRAFGSIENSSGNLLFDCILCIRAADPRCDIYVRVFSIRLVVTAEGSNFP